MTTAPGAGAISRHPGFKYAVGLWFAALLGFGLFVMPGPIHDFLSNSLGLPAILPAAEPPVGLAGRAALAGIAALLGLLLGLAIAQRIALANALEDEDNADWEQVPEAAAERPVWLDDGGREPQAAQPRAHRVFNPREEIDEDGIASPPHLDGRQDELVEAEGEDEAEDALMQAWREERGPLEEAETHLQEIEAEIEVFEENEADLFPAPAVPFVEEPAHEIEVAEIEPGDGWGEPEPEPEPKQAPELDPAPSLPPRDEAFGDMSLGALTARLGQALAAVRAREARSAEQPHAGPHREDADPVIAFLRREAGRHAPDTDTAAAFEDDPQAVLRSALDKLSRVSNPK